MSRREKMLALGVGVMAAIFVGTRLLDAVVLGPASRLDEQMQAAQARRTSLEQALLQQQPYVVKWSELGSWTLAADEAGAVIRLDAELKALIKKHNLRHASIKPQGTARLGATELRQLRFGVTAEGSLQDVVGFLYSFYRWPYLVRMRELSLGLSEVSGLGSVKINALIETLLLPPTKFLERISPAPPEATGQDQSGRLGPHATLATFAGIYTRNVFAPWQAPVEVRQPIVVPTTRIAQPPPPKVDPARDSTKVVALLSYWDERAGQLVQEVVAYNERSKQEQRVKLGEQLDGLKLVAVHWRGAVVEDETAKKWYLYPLGSKLSEKQELTDEEYPEIYRALEAAVR